MTKTAWLFPGQGSQKSGMGADLQKTEIGAKRLLEAEDILGWSAIDICQGEQEILSKTLYTQPCLYAIETILVDLLHDKGKSPSVVAGHSLGEYVALYAAGVFDFATGLKLVKRRAELMDRVAGGKMAALIGFKSEELEKLLAETPDVVLANDNSAMQVVISGKPEGVAAILSQIKVKKAVELPVSGAFHSPLMASAAEEFATVLQSATFSNARVPVLCNVEPSPETNGDILKERLVKQMTGSVRWRETCLQLVEEGIESVTEIGPGNVLVGLVKRTCSGLGLENIREVAQLPA
ncbi:ACP S-malonyltransferase [Roseofilum casamattae]|uniref:Malonyl CoA-acyl carrier protein transacylase n=1 Tax=Roseofilum casamattae BLCC-M143 TaxID=3022442 RepID=A0ABT7BUT9_9CYAN|nr:ACP S-malonyltransferase [Roseofilum casamattae]MDJ1182284.1 ACP S-malonyltransferase [Roseofilum casamattae BLCC-M143]